MREGHEFCVKLVMNGSRGCVCRVAWGGGRAGVRRNHEGEGEMPQCCRRELGSVQYDSVIRVRYFDIRRSESGCASLVAKWGNRGKRLEEHRVRKNLGFQRNGRVWEGNDCGADRCDVRTVGKDDRYTGGRFHLNGW